MRISLVAMPWQSLDVPSLPLAVLRARLAEARPGDEVSEYHGYLRWAEFLLEHSEGRITPADCAATAEHGTFHGLGDWVFSGVLYDDPSWGLATLKGYAARHGADIGTLLTMRPYAAAFIEQAVAEILATDPEVVGFTTTFMQTVPVLAAARRIKELAPEVTVVVGGGNCDGPMGAALHRNHPFLDHVVRGEGERALPDLLTRLEEGLPPSDVPGVCWWDPGMGVSVANEPAAHPVPQALVPTPDFDGWQRALEGSPVEEYVQPKLVLEGSRGCWWGDSHQCTFCGINGSVISFRGRPAERLFGELTRLVERHRVLDIVMVDNILDMAFFRDLLPRLAGLGWDLRIHYEVKANLRPDQVALLREAGVFSVQPGIESLSSRVLALMDKGVTGVANLRMLRECETNGLTAAWNLLYGFPGECAADYDPVVAQFPALVHLQPPGTVGRVELERFSPYFERPELGYAERLPAEMYDHVYDLPPEELADLVFFFRSPHHGVAGETEERLHSATELWRSGYRESSLVLREEPDGPVVLADRRLGWEHRDHVLTGWRARAYLLLERGRTAAALAAELDLPVEQVGEWLAEMLAYGLVFADDGSYVALATGAVPPKATPEQAAGAEQCRTHVRLPWWFPWLSADRPAAEDPA